MAALKSKIESLLFVSNKPLSVSKIASLAKAPLADAKKALDELFAQYASQKEGGVKLFRNRDSWQFGTAPENSPLVTQFLQEEFSGELTRPQLETLTIIAYRGPILKSELEQIRGVNCGLILRNLLIRGLIDAEEKEKSVLYGVSMDFLRFLGLTSVEGLPNYEHLHGHEAIKLLLENGPKI